MNLIAVVNIAAEVVFVLGKPIRKNARWNHDTARMEAVDNVSKMQFRYRRAASAVHRTAVIDEADCVGLMFVGGQPNRTGGKVVELDLITNASGVQFVPPPLKRRCTMGDKFLGRRWLKRRSHVVDTLIIHPCLQGHPVAKSRLKLATVAIIGVLPSEIHHRSAHHPVMNSCSTNDSRSLGISICMVSALAPAVITRSHLQAS
jgi:hypothetical protein